MSADDALWESLSRVAVEAGRVVRGAAEAAARELSGAFGRDQQQLPFPGSSLLTGPIIPACYKYRDQGLTWHDGYMASCLVSVVRAVQQQEVQPATASLVAAQAALHMRPGGYRLLQVGLNAHRVLRNGEWQRLGTSPLLHADAPHLVSNCTSLILEGLPMERRLGTARFLALVASTGLLTQGLYLLTSRLAADRLPRSSLANQYYTAYCIGFSGVAVALKVVAGYMREADLASSRVDVTEEFMLMAGRLAAWPSLLLSQYLVPGASLPMHLCGIAAGVLHVYGARALSWLWQRLGLRQRIRLEGGQLRRAGLPALISLGGAERHPKLGWKDLGSHLLLGGGTVLMMHAASRAKRR